MRHLKCGGENLTCARCEADGITCKYVPSRRGQGPRRRRRVEENRATEARMAVDSSSVSSVVPTPVSLQSPRAPGRPTDAFDPFELNETLRTRLISLYYVHFHPAHPILRPKAFATKHEPRYLELLMCYIGNHYDPSRKEVPGLHSELTLALSEPDEQSLARMYASLWANPSRSLVIIADFSAHSI
jgi:hypothetical protein